MIKAIVGIDVSKDTLDVQLATLSDEHKQVFSSKNQVKNTIQGYRKLLRWVRQCLGAETVAPWYVMEATGVYHENLAYFLTEKGHRVAVVLPTKMKHYFQSLDTKSKTDRLDARGIAQFGLERELDLWKPPSAQMRALKALTREYSTLSEQATQIKNQIHAKDHSHYPVPQSLDRMQEHLELLEQQMADIEQEIEQIVRQDDDLNSRIRNITSAKGVGLMTAVRVVAETNGFALISCAKQLASFAGFDIVLKQSGLRAGKSAISRKGNRHLRAAVFMPALASVRFNPVLKKFYERLVRTKANKKVALVAVARKLLLLIYALWRSNAPFDPDYELRKSVA
jgi:transposase